MHTSRRFAEWVTGLRSDPFRTARVKLTLVYIAIITAVVLVLSASLYEFHAHDVRGIGRRRAVPGIGRAAPEQDLPSLAEYLEQLGRSIVLADLVTIVVGGAAGFLLAARTLRPIKEAVREEQQFFANAAHDLRTPLAVMRTEAEVALRSPTIDEAEARRLIASELEEIQRMAVMVEQMLDLAKGRKAGLPHQPVDVACIARAAAQKIGRRALEKGLRLTVEAPEPARISGAPSSVERAVFNVLENAIAYTPSGGSVTVGVQRRGSHVVLDVRDTGIGIAAADLPHVTEPFYRGDPARDEHTGGAGLGLSIVKAVMDEHRGTLHIASKPGTGTTVQLRFPSA